jgi:phosphoribosylformimino-5-aminoimidazole carboxamide ribotide isomerase
MASSCQEEFRVRILPVLDVMGGVVVRGVGGRREEYRPIVSRLTDSCQPLDVARAFRGHFGFEAFYLADLDGIAGEPPARGLYAALQADGFRLTVDAGVRQAADGELLARAGVAEVVAGLETLTGPSELAGLCRRLDPGQVVFSLDLKHGRPVGHLDAWHTENPVEIADQAVTYGVRNVLILDLADVGRQRGTGTEALCRQLIQTFPTVTVIAGGGVRSRHDLEQLRSCGISGVLIASALHDGALSRHDLAET